MTLLIFNFKKQKYSKLTQLCHLTEDGQHFFYYSEVVNNITYNYTVPSKLHHLYHLDIPTVIIKTPQGIIKKWFKNNKLHRDDHRPAVIIENGGYPCSQRYYLNGKLYFPPKSLADGWDCF